MNIIILAWQAQPQSALDLASPDFGREVDGSHGAWPGPLVAVAGGRWWLDVGGFHGHKS